MSKIVSGITSLFGGTSNTAADLAAKQQSNSAAAASVNQLRQQQAVADQSASTNTSLAALGRAPRGQRLLVSSKDGGLANTLGTSA